MMDPTVSAAERKRKRLEAWRKRQKQATPVPPSAPAVKVSLSLGGIKEKKKFQRTRPKQEVTAASNPFQEDDSDSDQEAELQRKRKRAMGFELDDDEDDAAAEDTWGDVEAKSNTDDQSQKRRKLSRWDHAPNRTTETSRQTSAESVDDALDKFMDKLQTGVMGSIATQQATGESGSEMTLSINLAGSMMRNPATSKQPTPSPISGGVITPEQLVNLGSSTNKEKKPPDAIFTASDWESDAHGASASENEDDEEEMARQALIEALKSVPGPQPIPEEDEVSNRPAQLASEVKSEKHRREEQLRNLERDAEAARAAASRETDTGRIYNDVEGGVMEEAERYLDAAKAAPDALEVLAELNKKKELKAVDHSKVDYMPFKKNLYIVPRSLANLSNDEVVDRRAKLSVKVRGKGAPAPVSSFQECGISERIINIMEKQGISSPFPVQAQCLPCIMAGRDVIGIAKTGSGKTLAYLLPMLRHIGDQPPLGPHESGPIGLVLAPARELAAQIHSVCKVFAKHLGIKSTAVYGGAAVAEQIADLKRGTHIAVATPGRLIDILTMHSGKILSLQRVSYVVMDEADRMFDMGFSPQISAILAAVRPDRQTVLFSATFPKSVEMLARKSLKYPVEVIVGGRSVASDSVTQYAEVVEEEEKFLRLLQLLGEYADEGKVIAFVDTQVKADSLFEQLTRCGYPALSLHGGKDQEDRDSTISDFKRADGPGVLVATSVAGRGLDVTSCVCVINFSCPNHLEDYVHRVGRTGRAGNKGFAYTFVNSSDESKFAPNIVRALSEAGQSENISPSLKELSNAFKEKVEKGEAKWAGSGFKGKGYTYDATEMNDAQKFARSEKRQALIEAGVIDADDEDPVLDKSAKRSANETADAAEDGSDVATTEKGDEPLFGAKLSKELLSLPGMHDAIMRKAGMLKDSDGDPTLGRAVQLGANHFVQEFEINDYPREARWKVTQKETTSRLQDEFSTAVTLKGEYFGPNRTPGEEERKLYLHLEATSERILQNCMIEIRRLLNEETLRVGTRGLAGSSHKYNVLG